LLRETVSQTEQKYEIDTAKLNRYKDNAENNIRVYEENVQKTDRIFNEF
jgi:hypothetical protein